MIFIPFLVVPYIFDNRDFYNQKQVCFFERKNDRCQRLGWLFVLYLYWTLGRKEGPRGRGWSGTTSRSAARLDLFPHLSDGRPTICWGYPRSPRSVPEAALGATGAEWAGPGVAL